MKHRQLRLSIAASLLPFLFACAAGRSAEGTHHARVFEDERANVDRIIDEALSRGRVWDNLVELCETAPHRLAGSRGAERAVQWGVDAMNAAGLENVRLEPCTVPHWERGDVADLVLAAPASVKGERLPILALGGSIATSEEGVEAEVIEVKSFEELRARADEARGRIVLFNRPMDVTKRSTFEAYSGAVGQRVNGAAEAARVGAVAAIVRSMTTLRDDAPHTGAMRYADGVTKIPTAAVSTNGADRIAALLAKGKVRLRLRMNPQWFEPAQSYNVVGELVGSEHPDEIVVIGGHLDAWDVGQGAHDDGAGCCQAIEALRILKELGLRPRRTLRAVLFMNEENGLAGGRTYHEDHKEEMAKHVLAIESDRGAYTPRGFTSNAGEEALAILNGAASLLSDIGAGQVVPGGGGADISPMAASGVPLVGYLPDSQRYFDLHHSRLDTLDKINVRELELGAAALAALAYLVADMEEPLPRNEIESE